jgi:alanine racemase
LTSAADAAATGAVLTIDLGAIAANWRALAARVSPAQCASVVKADAYGLGADRVVPALLAAGCRHFFVAHLDEARALLPVLAAESGGDGARLYVLHGPMPGTAGAFARAGIVPVLNSAAQIAEWRALTDRPPAVIQIDTGMSRLGLPPEDVPSGDPGFPLAFAMSHLACADAPDHPANAAQLAAFARLRPAGTKASLAASSGIFLGRDYHFDIVRPGAALYGVAPVPGTANPMRPVVRLQARVIQTRTIPPGSAVGYGHTWRAAGTARIATVAVGYADGFLRSASGRGQAWLGGLALPFVGRVSMDSITLDATAAPAGALAPGGTVDLIGPHWTVDDAAAAAGTIGYEVLTALGRRYERIYVSEAGGEGV